VRVVPLDEAAAVNPKLDRSGLTDDMQVSFVPMAAVGAADGSIDVSTLRTYAEVKKGYTHFRNGDVLFAKVTPCMENGKMAVARNLRNGVGFGSTEFHVLRPGDSVDAQYLYHFVSSQIFRKEAARQMTGAVGLRRVPTAFLENAEFPLPPLARQREIVAEIEKQFSRLDEAVANLQRVKANLKRYKASILKAAVEGRLVETEASIAHREGRPYETGEQLLQRILDERRAKWRGRGKYKLPVGPLKDGLPSLPDGWTWANADQLTHLITSGSRGWGDFYSDTGVLFIRAQDIKTDALNFSDAARVDVPIDAEGTRSSVTEGDILVTITGANVTKSALVPALGELAFVSQHVALMKLAMPETASFVFTWIISPANGRKTLESWAYGAGKPGLSLEQMRALPIALPPLVRTDNRLSLLKSTATCPSPEKSRARSRPTSSVHRYCGRQR
jgi:type I restriction enzyme S subunit